MKLKTSVKTLFSDAETSLAGKIGIVSFLRRFSGRKTPISHYACRGDSLRAVTRLLDALGFENGKSYTVVSSELDTEFAQIKWPQNGFMIGHLRDAVSGTTADRPSYFDALYAAVSGQAKLPAGKTSGEVVGELLELLDDSDCEGSAASVRPEYDIPANRAHFAVVAGKATHEIAKYILSFRGKTFEEICEKTHETNSRELHCSDGATVILSDVRPPAKNFEFAFKKAFDYVDARFDDKGNPKSPDAPYIMPLAVLEVFTYMNGSNRGADFVTGAQRTLLFRVHDKALDLFKFASGHTCRVPWGGLCNMPLHYLWNSVDENGNETSPLRGFLFLGEETARKTRISEKSNITVFGNAAVIHDAEAEDNVSPAAAINNAPALWRYATDVYRAAYPSLEVGLFAESTIAVSSTYPAWNPAFSDRRIESRVKAEKSLTSAFEAPLLEYVVSIGERIGDGYTSIEDFVPESSHVTVSPSSGATPDFSADGLTKQEIPWEWYAMTHLGVSQDVTGRSSPNTLERPASDAHCKEALARFRKFIAENGDSAAFARDCRCGANPAMKPVVENGVSNYPPLAAFVDAVCVCFRTMTPANGTLKTAFHPSESRDRASLLTNVYSGVFTDLSPELGSSDDTGALFPRIVSQTGMSDCCGFHDDAERAAYTRLTDRLASGSAEQTAYAQRTRGTPRTFALVVETNVAASFIDDIGTSWRRLVEKLGTAFIQTLMLHRKDPICAYDENELEASSRQTAATFHRALFRSSKKFWNREFPPYAGYEFVPRIGRWTEASTGHTREFVKVLIRSDVHGRVIIVFLAKYDIVKYARLAYRFTSGLPLETASMLARRSDDNSVHRVVVENGRFDDLAVAKEAISHAVKYNHSEHERMLSCLVSGLVLEDSFVAVTRDNGEKAVRTPSHDWFTLYGGMINISSPSN